MRDYSKVGPTFWIGPTGKRLRAAGPEAQIVAMYLLTSPHANMLGLYYCPVMFIAHETGLGIEGASKGLQRAIEAGFCQYDEGSEVVWVMEMAAYQIGERLDANDKRAKGVQNEYDSLPENPYLAAFYEKYAGAFHMTWCRSGASPIEAPSKPLASQEQEQEQEIEQEQEQDMGAANAAPRPRQKRGTRLPDDWQLPKAWGEWALAEFPHWTPEIVRLEASKFADHWRSKATRDAAKFDWQATWRNWCRSDIAQRTHAPARSAANSLSFAERDEIARRKRWEEMTGRKWEESEERARTIDMGAVEPATFEVLQ